MQLWPKGKTEKNPKPQQEPQRASNLNLADPHIHIEYIGKSKVIENVFQIDKIVFFLFQVLIVAVSGYHLVLAKDLESIDKQIKEANKEITNLAQSERELRGFQDRLKFFKQVKTSFPKLSEQIDLIYGSTPGEVTVNSMELAKNKMVLGLTTSKGEHFAKLVISYLNSGKIDSVSLVSAQYKAERDNFDFGIEVFLK